MLSAPVYMPTERNRWSIDRDGAIMTSKRYDEVVPLEIDWSPQLSNGETISGTPTYVDGGVTRSSVTNTATTTRCLVTGTGETEVTIATTHGETRQLIARFYDATGGGLHERSDYGG